MFVFKYMDFNNRVKKPSLFLQNVAWAHLKLVQNHGGRYQRF
jgi:hypothetical protein